MTIVPSILLYRKTTNKESKRSLLLLRDHHLLPSLPSKTIMTEGGMKLRLLCFVIRGLDLPVLLTTRASIVRTTHQGPSTRLSRKSRIEETSVATVITVAFLNRLFVLTTRTTRA
jgi:hypothetical protein